MNLRKNSVTSQISFGFKMAPWENKGAIFLFCESPSKGKITLTTPSIIDICENLILKK
jgi:hypothetical protein